MLYRVGVSEQRASCGILSSPAAEPDLGSTRRHGTRGTATSTEARLDTFTNPASSGHNGDALTLCCSCCGFSIMLEAIPVNLAPPFLSLPRLKYSTSRD